uniref:Uncharacterized protein n=1 Tax=Moniliophthora roreri TaxID=221103 RepID=A0A0W0FR21_MONRR
MKLTADAGPSSATLRAASPTNTVNSTNEASAMAADNAKSSVYFSFSLIF